MKDLLSDRSIEAQAKSLLRIARDRGWPDALVISQARLMIEELARARSIAPLPEKDERTYAVWVCARAMVLAGQAAQHLHDVAHAPEPHRPRPAHPPVQKLLN